MSDAMLMDIKNVKRPTFWLSSQSLGLWLCDHHYRFHRRLIKMGDPKNSHVIWFFPQESIVLSGHLLPWA